MPRIKLRRRASDRRRLVRMQQQIESYLSGRLPLHALIDDLGFLLSNVENSPEEWKREMLSKIGKVEGIYSSALDKKAGILDQADHHLVTTSLAMVERLVRTQLKGA